MEELNKDLTKAVLDKGTASLTVLREGKSMEIALAAGMGDSLAKKSKQAHFMPRVPFVVDSIVAGGNASRSTLTKGDSIVAVNGRSTAYFGDFVRAMEQYRGGWVMIDAVRNGTLSSHLVLVDDNGRVGIGISLMNPTLLPFLP